MKKIIAVMLAVVLLLSISFVNFSAGGEELALSVGGVAVPSNDGKARLYNEKTDAYNGNVTVIELDDIKTQNRLADDASNDGTEPNGWIEPGDYDTYRWVSDSSAGNEKDPYYWESNPEEGGENLMFVAEYQNPENGVNYTYFSNLPAEVDTPKYEEENHVRYEPIPVPEARDIGSNYINITIPYFKYTDYDGVLGEARGRGTFDCLQSYAVFIKDKEGEQFKDWTYVGNSKPDKRWNQEANDPLAATTPMTEEEYNKYNTGRDYFDTRDNETFTLKEGFTYYFKVRVNFQSTKGDDMGGVWGYGGGLGVRNVWRRGAIGGSGTTFSSSGKSDAMPTGSEDTTPPWISITSPSSGEYEDSSVNIYWDSSDSGSGLDYHKIRLDSGVWKDTDTSDSHSYTSLSHGSHTVDVRAWDVAGNYNTSSVTFNVDTHAPSISISSPSDGLITNETDITIEWTGSDSGSGDSGLNYYKIKRDNETSWDYKGTSASHTYSSLSDGSHTVYVRAWDDVFNYNTDSVSFEVDTVDPSVTITSPSDGEILKDTDVIVTWSGSDSGSGIYYYEVRDDGGTWRNKSTSTSHTYTLTEGDHTVDVRAVDNASNSIIDTVTFTVAYSQDYALNTNSQSDDWTFLSTELIPVNPDLESILEDPDYGISGNYSKVMWYDASSDKWLTYVQGRGDHFNDLSTWNQSMGLWIQITGKDPLTVKGTLPTTTNIKLYPGWNMVGFPSKSDEKANLALPDEVSKIGVFDEIEEYNIRYITDLSTYTLTSGEGYWIYNSADTTITWSVSYS